MLLKGLMSLSILDESSFSISLISPLFLLLLNAFYISLSVCVSYDDMLDMFKGFYLEHSGISSQFLSLIKSEYFYEDY